jgi:hypothetical protein
MHKSTHCIMAKSAVYPSNAFENCEFKIGTG